MFYNFIKTSLRVFFKHKGYSLINIFGLSSGLAAFIIIFNYVWFEQSFDSFHKNVNRTFRVIRQDTLSNKKSASTFASVGRYLKDDVAEVEEAAMVYHTNGFFSIESENHFKSEHVFYSDYNFLKVFDFELTQGNASDILSKPQEIVLTESLAKKMFGDSDPIGRSVLYSDKNFGQQEFHVVGIIRTPPENTHLRFEAIASLSSKANESLRVEELRWGAFHNYVTLQAGTNHTDVSSRISGFLREEKPSSAETLALQPMKDIHLTTDIANEIGITVDNRVVRLLLALAVIVLVMAYINYTNLTAVKSQERSKEIGLRKIFGAARFSLLGQFLTESLVLNTICGVIAIAAAYLTLPVLEQYLGITLGHGLYPFYEVGAVILCVVGIGTVISGIYPAVVTSSIKSNESAKGKPIVKKINLRQLLVVLQYAVSFFMICSTFIIFLQIDFMVSRDTGFEKDNIVIVNRPLLVGQEGRQRMTSFRDAVQNLSGVVSVSGSDATPGDSYNFGTEVLAEGDEQSNGEYYMNSIDAGFLQHYNLQLLEGRNFRYDAMEADNILINETSLKQLGFLGPAEAIQKSVLMGDQKRNIIGVVKDYNHRSLKSEIDPLLFEPMDFIARLSVKFSSETEVAVLEKVEREFKKFFPGSMFEYYFLDQKYNEQYKNDVQLGKVYLLFCATGLIIACLGLLGLCSFTIFTRQREIGIKKILGASFLRINFDLAKQYLILVSIAIAITSPVAYYLLMGWLSQYAYHVMLGSSVFVSAAFILLLLTLFLVGTQTFKAANANPVDTLRNN